MNPEWTHTKIATAIGGLEKWHKRCHQASLALVRSNVLGERSRVARGVHPAVGGQHSWVVVGDDCYDEEAIIIDPTLWSYAHEGIPMLKIGKACEIGGHKPHGAGSIWDHGKPCDPQPDAVIELETEWSSEVRIFFETLIPKGLDPSGWWDLAHTPVGGWPSKEILTAMYQDDRLRKMIPIDIVGMATDINPDDLYW